MFHDALVPLYWFSGEAVGEQIPLTPFPERNEREAGATRCPFKGAAEWQDHQHSQDGYWAWVPRRPRLDLYHSVQELFSSAPPISSVFAFGSYVSGVTYKNYFPDQCQDFFLFPLSDSTHPLLTVTSFFLQFLFFIITCLQYTVAFISHGELVVGT